MVDLARSHAPLRDDLLQAAARVIDSGQFVLGPEVDRFERAFARSNHAVHAVGCASGTDALVLSLLAAGIGPGARVICPAFSFFATASAILRVGAQPVFADIDPRRLDLDLESTTALFDDFGPIHAIMVADLYGRVAPISALAELAGRFGIPLIEDAAQAVGAVDEEGGAAGTRSDFGCFSLYPTKNLGALGDGGIVLTHDADLAERMRSLRVHGVATGGFHSEVGLNSRLDPLQAALLGVKLPYLDKWTEARRAHAARYRDQFAAALGDPDRFGLELPPDETNQARHVYNQFIIQIEEHRRDGLRASLDQSGIDTGVYYPVPLHRQPAFRGRAETPVPLPNAEAASRRNVALPIHPDLRTDEIDRVVEAVSAYVRAAPER